MPAAVKIPDHGYSRINDAYRFGGIPLCMETIEEFKPDVIQVFSLSGLSKSLIFALRNSRLPTVYDIADRWLADDLRADAWLRW